MGKNIFKAFLRRAFKGIVLIVGHNGLNLGVYLGKVRLIKKIETKLSKYMRPEFVIFNGHKIYLDDSDALRLSSFGTDYHEENEYKIYEKYIRKGDIVVDVGAFIGDNSLDFARLVGDKGKVYAFEASQKNWELLKKNIEANNYKNIIAVNKAVSNKTGKLNMYHNPFRSSSDRIYGRDSLNNPVDWKAEEIEGTKLDDSIKGKVDFLKIDIEGAEPLAIEGAKRILKENKNLKIMIEFSPATVGNFDTTGEKYLKNFINSGFEIYNAKGFMENERVRIEEKSIREFLEDHKKEVLNLFLIKK
ncbi:hypothetical protein A3K73_01615 [Candidatus Pacearchaeota archaeon RBG_13_36_9]|nr:MAG: hypothetical protein A3K73_01615 [Candidatus Pacearchaeota archaeon RBG_13_36_9]